MSIYGNMMHQNRADLPSSRAPNSCQCRPFRHQIHTIMYFLSLARFVSSCHREFLTNNGGEKICGNSRGKLHFAPEKSRGITFSHVEDVLSAEEICKIGLFPGQGCEKCRKCGNFRASFSVLKSCCFFQDGEFLLHAEQHQWGSSGWQVYNPQEHIEVFFARIVPVREVGVCRAVEETGETQRGSVQGESNEFTRLVFYWNYHMKHSVLTFFLYAEYFNHFRILQWNMLSQSM